MKQGKILIVAAALTALFCLAMNAAVYASDVTVCPPLAKSCKIVVITDQEMQALVGPGMVFDAAEFANRFQLSGLVAAWKLKLANSPDGTVAPAPAPKKDEPKK